MIDNGQVKGPMVVSLDVTMKNGSEYHFHPDPWWKWARKAESDFVALIIRQGRSRIEIPESSILFVTVNVPAISEDPISLIPRQFEPTFWSRHFKRDSHRNS